MKCYLCKSDSYNVLFLKNGFRVVKCNKCDFVFVADPPIQKSLDNYYKFFDYKYDDCLENRIRNDAKLSLTTIRKFSNNRKLLLDIGCGRGYFIDEAIKYNFITQGVDTSKKNINYCRNVLHLNVKHTDIFKYKLNIPFDIITLNQIIEHLTKPELLLRRIRRLLKNNGLLYIATPNIESLNYKLYRSNSDYMIPPEHLGFYSKKTLRYLLSETGYKILKTGSWGYKEEMSGIYKAIFKRNQIYDIPHAQIDNQINKNYQPVKAVKVLLDKFISSSTYHILRFNGYGSMIEVLAIKK